MKFVQMIYAITFLGRGVERARELPCKGHYDEHKYPRLELKARGKKF